MTDKPAYPASGRCANCHIRFQIPDDVEWFTYNGTKYGPFHSDCARMFDKAVTERVDEGTQNEHSCPHPRCRKCGGCLATNGWGAFGHCNKCLDGEDKHE